MITVVVLRLYPPPAPRHRSITALRGVEATDDEVRRVAAAAEALVEGHADGMAYLLRVRDAC